MFGAGLVAGLMVFGVVLGPWSGPAAASSALDCAEREVRAVVHAAALGLAALLEGQPDERARMALIRNFIAPIRFYDDGSGYLYVYDMNCRNIAHAAQPELVGVNLRDLKDAKGKYAVREAVAVAKKGGGFFDFYWARPGMGGAHLKRGYVEPVPGTDYFIGSGVYVEK
ncbi:putative cache sensor protein [Desulfarculus baarsii DSM 2075]|uniref:Cache sensor protein n=1 Tax=Desulfarculus baarsii (strain ATCC 33931 / DSM 2075 / LMG 7858 / VKM B-1802 / 2st14) TaxID=644282 RepID=E1QDL6_DESB2|nr:putative cache sensor protein [Desulfarculus baarsii DSM 2075]